MMHQAEYILCVCACNIVVQWNGNLFLLHTYFKFVQHLFFYLKAILATDVPSHREIC